MQQRSWSRDNLNVLAGVVILACSAWFVLAVWPWNREDIERHHVEFAAAFLIELIIIAISFQVVKVFIERRDMANRDPVYRSIFADGYKIYEGVHDWIFRTMKESYARAAEESNLVGAFPLVPKEYADNQRRDRARGSSREIVTQFFKEHRSLGISFNKGALRDDIVKLLRDVEDFRQSHSGFLASDTTEGEGSQLLNASSSLRNMLRDLQDNLDAHPNDEVTLKFQAKGGCFCVRIVGTKDEEGPEARLVLGEDARRKYTPDLSPSLELNDFSEKIADKDKSLEKQYYAERKGVLECETLFNLASALSSETADDATVGASGTPGESGETRKDERYPKSLEKLHRVFADTGLPTACNRLGLVLSWYPGTGTDAKDRKREALSLFERAADQDDGDAYYNLALMYLRGEGCEKDAGKAFKELERAADLGLPKASTRLGLMYRDGTGVEANIESCEVHLRKGADADDADAQYCLGLLFADGIKREPDYTQARSWFCKAAKQRHVDAQYRLGELHLDAIYGERNLAQAADWLRCAAKRGHADAQVSLGRLYRDEDYAERDPELAREWFERAAEAGNSEAQWELAMTMNDPDGGRRDAASSLERLRKAASEGHTGARFLALMLATNDAQLAARPEDLPWIRHEAEKGNAEAQNSLGVLHLRVGETSEGADWLRRADVNGDETAPANLWSLYQAGLIAEPDATTVFGWTRAAAERGDTDARYHLARALLVGEGTEQDETEGVSCLQEAADEGHAEAQNTLGDMCRNGVAVVANETEAANWFRKAAEQGHLDASCNLMEMYLDGRGTDPADIAGRTDANVWIGRAATRGHARSVDLIRTLAEAGQYFARFSLGHMYLEGRVVAKDVGKGLELLSDVADGGDAGAQFVLACTYAVGEVVPRDEETAAKWMRRAAEQEHSGAECWLGKMFFDGRGVEGSYTMAAKWWGRAAEHGNSDAQAEIGMMYTDGLGVERNDVEAAKWMRLAAEQGHAEAQFRLASMLIPRARGGGGQGRSDGMARPLSRAVLRPCSRKSRVVRRGGPPGRHVPPRHPLLEGRGEGAGLLPGTAVDARLGRGGQSRDARPDSQSG